MDSKQLGNTDIRISTMGFGAWAIGGGGDGIGYGQVAEGEAEACIQGYIDAGGNHVDTARYYNHSERIIGNTLKRMKCRDQVVIASKSQHNTRSGILKDFETSTRLLQTDYIDIYYLHAPPDDVGEMNCALGVFEELKQLGKIRAIGASIKGPNVTQATVDLCRQYIDSGKIDAIQLIYSILRQKNADIFDYAASKRVSLIARTSLESGFLTGKYSMGHTFATGDHRTRFSEENMTNILTAAERLAVEAVQPPYRALSETAIRFTMAPSAITSTIVGAKTGDQLHSNLGVLDLPELDQARVAKLIDEFKPRNDEFNCS